MNGTQMHASHSYPTCLLTNPSRSYGYFQVNPPPTSSPIQQLTSASTHADQQLLLHLHRPAHHRLHLRPLAQLRRAHRPGRHAALPVDARRARRDARARPHRRVRQRERAELQAGAPALVRAHDPVPCGERGGRVEDHFDDEVRIGGCGMCVGNDR